MREKLIAAISIALVALIGLSAIFYIQKKEIDAEADQMWNGGIHKEDGGNWRIKGTQGRSGQYIIYECDKCGKTFEATSRLR